MAEKRIPFMKMNGCGNDFIVVDNRQRVMDGFVLAEFVKKVCARGTSLGADGFMMLESSDIADFAMRYFNADGSEGEMCGNGARCIARFAHLVGAAGKQMRFETLAGVYEAQINTKTQTVKVKFPDVALRELKLNQPYQPAEPAAHYHYGLVGVPHTLWFVDRLAEIPDQQIVEWGRQIRHDTRLFPQGTNVNFVEVPDCHSLRIRTYERGVERESYACGSGSTAAAIVAGILGLVDAAAPVDVHTRGGACGCAYARRRADDFLCADRRCSQRTIYGRKCKAGRKRRAAAGRLGVTRNKGDSRFIADWWLHPDCMYGHCVGRRKLFQEKVIISYFFSSSDGQFPPVVICCNSPCKVEYRPLGTDMITN